MRTIDRYLGREIYKATAFVFVAFLALFAFFDLVNELDDLGKGGYRLQHAFLYIALLLPGHAYELFPIVVLIGTLSALATLAANSEFTVMRVAGFSPAQAVWTLGRIGAVLVVIAVVFGEVLAPIAEQAAQRLRLEQIGSAVGSDLADRDLGEDRHPVRERGTGPPGFDPQGRAHLRVRPRVPPALDQPRRGGALRGQEPLAALGRHRDRVRERPYERPKARFDLLGIGS